LAVALIAIAPPPAAAQHSVLLLGITPGEPRTILVETHGDTVRARSGTGFIVPRKTGFWRVGTDAPTPDYPELRRQAVAYHHIDTTLTDSARAAMAVAEEERRTREEAVAESLRAARPDTASPEETNAYGEPLGHEPCFARQLWAAPLGSWPVLAPPSCAEGTDLGGDVFWRFVGPEHVSASLELTGEYSYGFARSVILGGIDSLARGFTDIYADLAGGGAPAPSAAVRAAERKCNDEWIRGMLQQDPADYPEGVGDFRGTLIHRLSGRWTYARYYALTSHAGRGAESTCDMNIRVPRSVTGWDSLTVPWRTIKRTMPSAFDAFASPSGDVVVVLTPTGLVVRRRAGSALGKTLAEFSWAELHPMSIIARDVEVTAMSQWATGVNADRWARELAPVLDRPARPKGKTTPP
jgi:hypothetical protein